MFKPLKGFFDTTGEDWWLLPGIFLKTSLVLSWFTIRFISALISFSLWTTDAFLVCLLIKVYDYTVTACCTSADPWNVLSVKVPLKLWASSLKILLQCFRFKSFGWFVLYFQWWFTVLFQIKQCDILSERRIFAWQTVSSMPKAYFGHLHFL